MKLAQNAKRVAVFAYFDKDGVVDDYVPVLVAAVRAHCAFLVCMVNGTLNEEGNAKLTEVSDVLLYRENTGLDVTAYKEGYRYLRDTGALNDTDELLFFNQTVFGPVHPLAEMFGAMNEKDLDFWGFSLHPGLDADLSDTMWHKIEYGYMPPHLQSYFFAVRSSLLHTREFDDYWESLPEIHDYVEAVSFHEVKFTKYFTDLGYHSDAYLDCSAYNTVTDYAVMGMPTQLLHTQRCPFIKRKSFLDARTAYLSVPQGSAAAELLHYLAEETAYDVQLIAQNITRTVPASAYLPALSLTAMPQKSDAVGKIAAVYDLPDLSMLDAVVQSAATLPIGSGVFCMVANEVDVCTLRAALPNAVLHRTEQGGLSALFGTLASQLEKFDYMLYLSAAAPTVSDGLHNQTLPLTAFDALGDGRADLAMLHRLPCTGVLLPLPCAARNELLTERPAAEQQNWINAFESQISATCAIGELLPRLPGNGFFAKTATVLPLTKLPWDQFVSEEKAQLEFLLPLAAQAAGEFCGFAAPWDTAVREFWNAREYAGRFAKIFATERKQSADLIEFRMNAILDFYHERRYSMTLEQAFTAPLSFKEKLWIILRILMKPATFARLYKLTHGHEMPPQDHPQDALD